MVEKAKKVEYNATLTLLGKIYKAKGKTPLEAIVNLKPEHGKGIGVLVVERGDKRAEKIIGRPLMHRLFGETSTMMRDIARKQISMMFNI